MIPPSRDRVPEPAPDARRRANALAWGLLALFVILFAGTFLVGLLYLAAD
jgi:hypothetical protein